MYSNSNYSFYSPFGFVNSTPTNKSARIVSRISKNGKLRTETALRDEGTTNVAMTTDEKTNATKLFLDLDDGSTVSLSGREARTLYRVMRRHYRFANKSR